MPQPQDFLDKIKDISGLSDSEIYNGLGVSRQRYHHWKLKGTCPLRFVKELAYIADLDLDETILLYFTDKDSLTL